MAAALRETNQLLASATYRSQNLQQLMCLILGLMITARLSGDEAAAAAHISGLFALWTATWQSPAQRSSDSALCATALVCFFDQWWEPKASAAQLMAVLRDAEAERVLKPSSGLNELEKAGLLDCRAPNQMRTIALSTVDSGSLIDRHECLRFWSFKTAEVQSQAGRDYEVLMYIALRIVSHTLVFGSWNTACSAVVNVLRVAELALARINIADILDHRPAFAAWICLVLGAACTTAPRDPHMGTTVHVMLTAWRDKLVDELGWAFDHAVWQASTHFYWLQAFEHAARRFWLEGITETGYAAARPCSCTVDSMERSLSEPFSMEFDEHDYEWGSRAVSMPQHIES